MADTKYYLEYIRSSNNLIIENEQKVLQLIGSGTTVLDIQGSQGQLFSITDSLTGDIFIVSDISGIPILTVNSDGTVTVDGAFYATEKHFRIKHPDTSKNKYLVYSSLETPFNSVQLHGKGTISQLKSKVDLPDYINKLIHNDNINIQLTPIKTYVNYYVSDINIDQNYFEVSIKDFEDGTYEYFWTLTGERKDIDKLIVEQD